ncbi:protein CC2D2B [Coregonus clupeaformis]|uniref:protein CC2D2B n=1 Tax=Coregonus clupeaformis TaxID=59861 RepID=UPI001BDFC6EC|nr:protein CC2D2B [Coregonus clupeaformis]
MTEENKEKLQLQDGVHIQERVIQHPPHIRLSRSQERGRLMLQEYKLKTLQSKINVAREVRIKEPQKIADKQSCSEEEAYRFFCHEFDELERNGPTTGTLSQQSGIDTVIDIENVDECHNPLVPGDIETLDVNPDLLFVPSDLPVNQMRIIPRYLKPRFLEDEGFYVCERPQVPRKMMNKMDNRLIEEEKGQSWFGENGCVIAIPDPIQKYWHCKVDFPFSSQSPCLTTVHMRPDKLRSAGSVVSNAEASAGLWQLDLNLARLNFTHHPLFCTEHVLAQRLYELYERYETREMKGATTFLQEKLRGLKKSETALTTTDETAPGSKLRNLRQEIRKTHVALKNERQADISLVRNIVAAWKRIKTLRAKNGYVSTTVKLQLHKVKARITDSATNRTGTDEHMKARLYTDGDVTIKQHYLCRELKEHKEEEIYIPPVPGQEEETFTDSVNQKADQLDLVPVLTMCGVVTPTSSCPPDEKVRRYELANHKVSVNIFYNGKHVSTSEPSTFDSDFRVQIQQMFNMQIIHSPENIMLEICETVKHKSTVVAKIYVPIPDRNMLSSNATMERSEFSSDRTIKAYYAGVGSNVPFKLEKEDTEVCLMTSGRLMYVVSWAVDESGFPMAPTAPPHRPSFTRPMVSGPNASRLEWIRDLQCDPNHPSNTELTELLREACEQRDRATGHFRLHALEEEFDFTTEEQLEKSRRFGLLQLRSSHAVDVSLSKPIPLHDRDITEAMFADYDASPSLFLMDEDPITMQRARSIHYIQKALNLARTKLLNIKRKYKFSDIVTEYQEADTVMEFDWDMFRLKRPLRPQRVKTKIIPTCSLSDGDLRIRVAINNAQALPVRQEAFLKEIHARGSCCGLTSSSRHNMTSSSEKAVLQAQVQPFVEVRFQETTYESSIEQGPNPCWREEFTLEFKSLGGDYSHAALSKVQDNIVINVFDEMSFQVIESSSLRGCGTQVFSGRQWLGSVTLPFRSLLQQSKDGDQKPLWLLSTDEDEDLLDLTYEYEKQCKVAAGRVKKRVITTVINSEGKFVLAHRFFKPLPPPQEVVLDTPDNSMSVLERVAAFVSLIPTLSFPSDVGDSGDMWLTSEQCLELAMGNDVSLAVLLCNFFHDLKLNGWLLVGTSVIEGETTYVLTQENTWFVLWNPRDGKHYQSYDSFCPLKTVDCLVNGENVWFHLQPTRKMPITFDVSNNATWKPLFPKGFNSDKSSMPTEIKYHPSQIDLVNLLQRRMEMKLKSCVMDWRSPHPTRWSPRCAVMFSEVMQKLERNPAPDTLELEIDRVLDTMKDYKVTGFPIHMAYQDMSTVIEAVYNTRIHSTEIPGTEFALSTYIHPYPNHILSVWIFLATLVKHQHGVFYVPSVHEH